MHPSALLLGAGAGDGGGVALPARSVGSLNLSLTRLWGWAKLQASDTLTLRRGRIDGSSTRTALPLCRRTRPSTTPTQSLRVLALPSLSQESRSLLPSPRYLSLSPPPPPSMSLYSLSLSLSRPFSLLHFLFPILFRPHAHLDMHMHAHDKYKQITSKSQVSNMDECGIRFIRQPTHGLWEGMGICIGAGGLFSLVMCISRICGTVVRASCD